MMKQLTYYFRSLSLLVWAGWAASCSEEAPLPDANQHPAGKVPVEVHLGGAYSPLLSRAAENNFWLKDSTAHALPNGSTLRLIILKNQLQNDQLGIKKTDILDDSGLEMTYVVKTDEGGSQSLYPCKVDEDGNVISGTETLVPYYLPIPATSTTYYCMGISPAKELEEVTEGGDTYSKVAVRNQETFLASNNKWTETCNSSFTVPADPTESVVIKLKPLMHTTARIKITMQNGPYITSLTPSAPGFELDRIPTNPGSSWTPDGGNTITQPTTQMPEQNLAIGDTIQLQMGNNILYNRIYVDELHCNTLVSTWPAGWYNSQGKQVTEGQHDLNWPKEDGNREKIEIVGETTILPMDARPTPMIIVLNAIVNNIPMQFQFQVKDVFLAGHSYNYRATIRMEEGGIYIASWQDKSWGTDLYPNQPK